MSQSPPHPLIAQSRRVDVHMDGTIDPTDLPLGAAFSAARKILQRYHDEGAEITIIAYKNPVQGMEWFVNGKHFCTQK